MTDWDWPDNAFLQRRKAWTVGQRIHWSYAWLCATRIVQNMQLPAGQRRRNFRANKLYGKLNRAEISIGNLERDLFQSMFAIPVCLHCGSATQLTKDHLIPRSRGGDGDAENIVTCCASCNSSKGNADLMAWYRRRQKFPCLVLVRQYLKVCYKYTALAGGMDLEVSEALGRGLPFDPMELPEKFPDVENLRYDWRVVSS